MTRTIRWGFVACALTMMACGEREQSSSPSTSVKTETQSTTVQVVPAATQRFEKFYADRFGDLGALDVHAAGRSTAANGAARVTSDSPVLDADEAKLRQSAHRDGFVAPAPITPAIGGGR